MKCVLVGHPESQFLVPASRYLAEKYLPGFHIEFINNTGSTGEWSSLLREYLRKLNDELVVIALDDYLLSAPYSEEGFSMAVDQMKSNEDIDCIKLCETTLGEHAEYPVTTQYTLWRRMPLIDLLGKTADPWDFEMRGSKLVRASRHLCLTNPVVHYNVHSALSRRWYGLNLKGLSEEDSAAVQKLIVN